MSQQRRPIDIQRDAAFSTKIDGAGALTDMISIREALYLISERGIHTAMLADQIDPKRTNPNIPHTQQRVLNVGSSDPVVGRILLTADALFEPKFLGSDFNRDEGLRQALDLVKGFVAMADIRDKFLSEDSDARKAFRERNQPKGSAQLPSIDGLEAKFDSFTQKVGHVVDALGRVAKLFYGEELTRKWVDSLSRLTVDKFGAEHPFAKFMEDARPFLLNHREVRNLIEHPTRDQYVEVRDFALMASGEIDPPAMIVHRPDGSCEKSALGLLMSHVIDQLIPISELMFAFLCAANVHTFSGFPVFVAEIPEGERGRTHQRYRYYSELNGQVAPID
jgi:hypothetical protein